MYCTHSLGNACFLFARNISLTAFLPGGGADAKRAFARSLVLPQARLERCPRKRKASRGALAALSNAFTTHLKLVQRTLHSVLNQPSDHPLVALTGLVAAYGVLFNLEGDKAVRETASDFATFTATRAGVMRSNEHCGQQRHSSF
jgi:hypothetical protein